MYSKQEQKLSLIAIFPSVTVVMCYFAEIDLLTLKKFKSRKDSKRVFMCLIRTVSGNSTFAHFVPPPPYHLENPL